MERTVFNKAQLEMLDIMANIRSDEELDALKHAVRNGKIMAVREMERTDVERIG